MELFEGRLVNASNETHFVGRWPPAVKIGEDTFLPLQEVDLHVACNKAELELHRSKLFAHKILAMPREKAVEIWKLAVKWETKGFIERSKRDIAELKLIREMA